MAQLGSALDWGSRGRRFKSCQPDAEDALIGKTIDWSVFIIGFIVYRCFLSTMLFAKIRRGTGNPVLVIKLLLSHLLPYPSIP